MHEMYHRLRAIAFLAAIMDAYFFNAGVQLSIDDVPTVDEDDVLLTVCVNVFGDLDGSQSAKLITVDDTAKGTY